MSSPFKLQQWHFYEIEHRPRPFYDGMPLKPAGEKLRGSVDIVQASWLQDDEDRYPGEWALHRADYSRFVDGETLDEIILSVSSGDVAVLTEIAEDDPRNPLSKYHA